MHVIIPDNLNIYLSNISAIEEDVVEKHFQAERKGRYYVDVAQSTWDGVYRKYHRGKKRLARPFLGMLCQLCQEKGFPITIEDQREPSKYPLMPIETVDVSLLPGITLEDYQLSGILKIYNAQVGIFDVPTGGGKSELIAGICKVANCPTVVLAEQKVVVDQLVKRLELRMVTEEVGMFMAGRMPTGQLIIVGTVQSLVSPTKQPSVPALPDGLPRANAVAIFNTMKNGEEYECQKTEKNTYTDIGKLEKKYVDKIKKYFSSVKAFKTRKKKAALLHKLVANCEMILIDECDLATSKIYQSIFRFWFKGRRRYGFTGTASDDDRPVEQLIMKEHLGSIIHKISRKRLEEANRTIPFEYWMIAHGEDGCKNDKRMFDVAVNELMVYDESFHDLIINICNYIHTEDDTKGILILVERDDLGHALKSKIPGSEFIHGKTPAKQRPLILSAFEQRVSRVLIGGKNVKRGMDLSGGCEEMILATGGKLSSGLKQQIGRANRLNRLGKARIWDALFLNNEYLYDHSRKRLKTIISMSYPSFVMFKDGVHDGEQFVKSRYRRTKRSYISQSLF